MKPAGFLCKIDKLGRIVVPKPLRTKYDLNIDDTIELFTDNDSIILKKYRAATTTLCPLRARLSAKTVLQSSTKSDTIYTS